MSNLEIAGVAASLAVASSAAGSAMPAELALDLAASQYSTGRGLALQDERSMLDKLRSESLGFGKLQKFFDDPEIEEIWVNQPNEVFFAKNGRVDREFMALSAGEISALVERMLRSTGRRLDRATPFVDAALPDGSRLHVVIPDISRSHWAINVRRFPSKVWNLAELVQRQAITVSQASYLSHRVAEGANIMVSGATQAGKTTILCALIEQANGDLRLVSVEETFELRSTKPDWVAMQTRQANLEGRGEISLRRLVKESLRMRPQLLVVGEVREAESLDLLIAMNSGITGMCTIHANSASAAITKLCTLPLLAGSNISPDFVRQTVAECIDLVVQCEMTASGQRRVSEIAELKFRDERFELVAAAC